MVDPTPTSPEVKSPKKERKLDRAGQHVKVQIHDVLPTAPQKQPVSPTTPQRTVPNEIEYSQNVESGAHGADFSTSERSKLFPVVLITPQSSENRHTDYVDKRPVNVAKHEASRKRKRESGIEVAEKTTQTRDQRLVSSEALQRVQEILQDVFEADDQLQADGSGNTTLNLAELFVFVSFEDCERHSLAPAVHVKLESALHKAISTGSFKDVPVDHLHRLEGLCEAALGSAESSELQIEPGWNDDDFERWVQRSQAVDIGLRSARTILRIMVGGREEKELYGEELLQSVIRVVEKALSACVIPVVEARSTDSSSGLFQSASSYKKVISQLLYDASKVMGLLSELLVRVDMAEVIVTTMEFLATRILFVENAHSEKESVLGVQKFETLRRTAMDMIAQIFSRYHEQRIFIFDEILTSLQKLPITRQHARQFKLTDGTSIQLVSALIMRLVQTSGTQSAVVIKKGRAKPPLITNRDGQSISEDESINAMDTPSDASTSDTESKDSTESPSKKAVQRLGKDANLLNDSAAKNAQYVVRFFVHRAMTASKTGDQPHRHLLDIFSEDLIAVLGSPEWPGAELLLRALLVLTVDIAEKPKSPAPAKTMALELLGLMGAAISELVATTRHAARSLENHESVFSGYLRQMLDDYMEGALENNELLGWDGPYRAVIEHLQPTGSGDLQLKSAQGYYLTQWAKAVSSGNLTMNPANQKLMNRLRKMLATSEWITSDRSEETSSSQSRLAYALTVLNMDFCRQFDRVLKILLDSISSDQITVRTRSLKSVTQMLEKDPSLLDRARTVKVLIMKCATDTSSMVRDSALMLIGKCIVLRPALEQEFCKTILVLANDPTIGVRKRSMRLLKEIYLRNPRNDIKTIIGESLLQRVKDPDKGVSDLSRQIFEEIWLSPFLSSLDSIDIPVQDQIALKDQVNLIIRTVQRGESVASVMVNLIREVLSNDSKSATTNFKVCKRFVASAFETMIDTDEQAERLDQRHILQTLTVFAKANAKLFTSDQLQYLQPYIANLSNSDDLNLFKCVVVIFRCVLPVMPTVQHGLLREIQIVLLRSVSKLGRAELNEVAACLWTINGTLKDPEKLIKLTVSVIKNLHSLKDIDFADQGQKENLNRLKKYIRIAGYFGKYCDFEDRIHAFQDSLPWWKGASVAGLIVNSISPFAAAKQPLSLRAEALNSIGLVCQSFPHQFNEEHISNVFQQVLITGDPELQNIVLSSFKEFFALQEGQAEVKTEKAQGENGAINGGKLGGSMTASDSDGASALIAQRFLKNVLRIALASQDLSALTATEVVTSINRQGLVHPKESGPALVALETSTNPAIAAVAFQEHRNLHQQHESMFEREYMRAIREAFQYQQEILRDPLGFTMQPPAAKLHSMFEIIKTSKGKYQKKFLSNYCSKIDFDIAKLDVSGSPPPSLQYSRFLIENLALFDYGRIDELLHTIACMERIVAGTGSGIAHSINTEIFHIGVESSPAPPGETARETGSADNASSISFDATRLRQLTTGSIMLSCLWDARTYLRRLYGLTASQQRRDSKAKAAAKDLNKVPTKAQGVNGDRLIAAIAGKVNSLDSQESMLQQCQGFVELLSVDNEVKVAAEGEEDVERPETPSGGDDCDTPMQARGGPKTLKRKTSESVGGTPQKRPKGRPSLGKRKKSGKSVDEDDDWD